MSTGDALSQSPDRDSDLANALVALTFAVRWLAYGGADAYEIYVTFGLTPAQFGQRLRRAADWPEALRHLDLAPGDHDRLLAEARRLAVMPWTTASSEAS